MKLFDWKYDFQQKYIRQKKKKNIKNLYIHITRQPAATQQRQKKNPIHIFFFFAVIDEIRSRACVYCCVRALCHGRTLTK